jgi:hypothetical protein
VVCRIIADCDGRSIFAAEHFAEQGLPRELIDRAVAFHGSDLVTSMTVIIRHEDRKLVQAITGVYDLDLLYQIAQTLGIPYKRKKGSRSQATALKEAIQDYYAARDRPRQASRARAVPRHGRDADSHRRIR